MNTAMTATAKCVYKKIKKESINSRMLINICDRDIQDGINTDQMG